MITNEETQKIAAWLTGRLPQEWTPAPGDVAVDRDEITVYVRAEDVEVDADASEAVIAEARTGRARAFRESTREQRMAIAREAEHRFERKVSWGVRVGGGNGHQELWTNVSAPVMTRLRQPQRMVLDTLVDSGVAKSRSDALGWCVRLVAQHEDDWLASLRSAMTEVDEVRRRGPAA